MRRPSRSLYTDRYVRKVTDRQRRIERRNDRGIIVANMPEEMTEENVAEEAVVSQVSGSSCQDRSLGEVMVYMGQGFGLTCQVMEQNVMEKMEFS